MDTFNARRLEQELAQEIESLYLNQLGHQPSQVSCKFLDGQQKLVIFIEGSLTKPEQLLVTAGQIKSAATFRSRIEDVIRPRLKMLIEQTARVSITELLIDTRVTTQNSSAIAILANR
jgi:uncharacterized protein YbcI